MPTGVVLFAPGRKVDVQLNVDQVEPFGEGRERLPQFVPLPGALKSSLQHSRPLIALAPTRNQRGGKLLQPAQQQDKLAIAEKAADSQDCNQRNHCRDCQNVVLRILAEHSRHCHQAAKQSDDSDGLARPVPAPNQSMVQMTTIRAVDAAAGQLASQDGHYHVQNRDSQ